MSCSRNRNIYAFAPADAENSVREALKMGYRLIDTANAYVNERAVGRGMKDSVRESVNAWISGLGYF